MNKSTLKRSLLLGILTLAICMVLWLISARNRGSKVVIAPPSTIQDSKSNVIEQAAVQEGNAKENWWTNRYARKKGSRDATIDFWGRVVDERGAPIPDASVELSIRRWDGFGSILSQEARFKKVHLTTDADGRFSLVDAMGDSLTITSFTKAGYVSAEGQDLMFTYGTPSDFVPKKDAPQIFVLIKSSAATAADVRAFKYLTRIPCNNGVAGFELLGGQKSFGDQAKGDVLVYFNREPEIVPIGNTNYSWKFRVELSEGGIVLIDDSARTYLDAKLGLMLEAPETGYTPSVEMSVNVGDPDWRNSEVLTFYFKAGNNFGKAVLQINAWANRESTALNFVGVLNPTGSRHLGAATGR